METHAERTLLYALGSSLLFPSAKTIITRVRTCSPLSRCGLHACWFIHVYIISYSWTRNENYTDYYREFPYNHGKRSLPFAFIIRSATFPRHFCYRCFFFLFSPPFIRPSPFPFSFFTGSFFLFFFLASRKSRTLIYSVKSSGSRRVNRLVGGRSNWFVAIWREKASTRRRTRFFTAICFSFASRGVCRCQRRGGKTVWKLRISCVITCYIKSFQSYLLHLLC